MWQILTIVGGTLIVAFFSTLTVLALASRVFAFYYTLQCLVAFNVSQNRAQRIGIALVAALLLSRRPFMNWQRIFNSVVFKDLWTNWIANKISIYSY